MAALSVVVWPKCGQGSRATRPARSPLDSQVRLDAGLSAWELDCHASADQHAAGQSLCAIVPEYPLRTDRTPSIGHAAGTLPAAAPWRMQASSWHSVMIAPLNGS